eukprot:813437-Prymnesium_polylepis.1
MPSDYWLVEVSGLPFGVQSELMAGDCLMPVLRGLLHGTTVRDAPGLCGASGPAEYWRVLDAFGAGRSALRGYWEPRPPVSVSCAGVHASAYVRRGLASLVVLASFGVDDVTGGGTFTSRWASARCSLSFDWAQLGLAPRAARLLTVPYTHSGAPRPALRIWLEPPSYGASLPVYANRGYVLLLDDGDAASPAAALRAAPNVSASYAALEAAFYPPLTPSPTESTLYHQAARGPFISPCAAPSAGKRPRGCSQAHLQAGPPRPWGASQACDADVADELLDVQLERGLTRVSANRTAGAFRPEWDGRADGEAPRHGAPRHRLLKAGRRGPRGLSKAFARWSDERPPPGGS